MAYTRLVIDQIYQELVSTGNLSIKQLMHHLDKNGYIKLSNLISFLNRYSIDLNDEEISLIFESSGKTLNNGEKMIWFKKLIEDWICNIFIIW